LCGRHCTYGAGLALVVRLGRVVAAADCVAGVALGDSDRRFAWQAWRLATSTCILRGRRGAYGTGLALVARLGPVVAAAVFVAGAFHGVGHVLCAATQRTHTDIHAVIHTHDTRKQIQTYKQVFHTPVFHTYLSPSHVSFLPTFPFRLHLFFCDLLEEVDMWGSPALEFWMILEVSGGFWF